MYSHNQYNPIISGLIERIQDEVSGINSAVVSLQTHQKKLMGLIPILESLRPDNDQLNTENPRAINAAAYDHGRPVFKGDNWKPDYNNFDVVLNLPENSLQIRLDPKRKSKFVDRPFDHLGRRYLKLLIYMLSHPTAPICSETANNIYKDGRELLPNTLAKSIKALRTLLDLSNPDTGYILTEKDPAESHSATGSFYQMNPAYQYLVILKDFKDSPELP